MNPARPPGPTSTTPENDSEASLRRENDSLREELCEAQETLDAAVEIIDAALNEVREAAAKA